MNKVILIGNVTKDPQIAYGASSGTCVARFSVALNRGKNKAGEDLGADFPSVVCFGKTAEVVEKWIKKGRKIAIEGRIQTGSYQDKDGKTVYTTDVIADKVEFVDKSDRPAEAKEQEYQGFNKLTGEDIPF